MIMTYYSNYHAYRKFNIKKMRYGWVADALLKPNTNNSLERDGYVYICSKQGYGDCAITLGKHTVLSSSSVLSFIKRYSYPLYLKVYPLVMRFA